VPTVADGPNTAAGPTAADGGSGTTRVRDGSGWQGVGGYSRAVRRGDLIAVSGTTAHGPDGTTLFPGDTYSQAQHCFEVVLAAVRALGGGPHDVVRTRVLLAPGADWEAATRAHGEAFAQSLPANSTYYVAALIGDGFLVEVEAEALVLA
jgi:enamine deaminase RidA (YjgF/YER057c/UK114 family)